MLDFRGAQKMTEGVSPASKWIKRLSPDDGAAVTMICFPPAGGGVMGYWPWGAPLRGHINVHAAALPGREQRLREAPARMLDDIVNATGDALSAFSDRPLILFGHSFGALIAYETLRSQFESGRLSPARVHFIASGRLPPHLSSKTPRLSHLPARDIVFRIAALYRNIPPALLEDAAYVESIGGALQADLKINEDYLWREGAPLPCPVTAVGGTSDPAVSPTELGEWARHAREGFDLRVLDGDHFYFRTPAGQSALLDIVLSCAASLAATVDASAS